MLVILPLCSRTSNTVHTYHLHLAEVDDPVLVKPLQFRDYLRQHPDSAADYGTLKKQLSKVCGQNVKAYVAGKTALVENVMLQIKQKSPRLGVT